MGYYLVVVLPLVLLYSSVLIVMPVCRALVPEISLKSNPAATKSSVTTTTANDVISETRTLGVGKWPTLNITTTRLKTSSSTKLAIPTDPGNPSSGLSINSNTIQHLDPNTAAAAAVIPTATKRKKKTRHRNKWNHHSPSSKFGARGPFWTQNDILESPTTKPPTSYSLQ